MIDGANLYRYAGNDPINFYDPTGLSQAGNPLNNLYGSFDAYAGGYSGGVVAPKPKDVFFSPVSYGPVNSISTSSLINSPMNIDYTYYGPATNANSLNRTDPLYNYTPSRQITGIRPIGGDSLGDMVLGSAASSLNRSINTTTSPGAAFAGQLASPFVNAAKGVLDVIGPRSEPSYERRYSDGSRDFYLGGEPSTGDLLNQGLALLPAVLPRSAPRTSTPRPSFYNVADNGIDLTTYRAAPSAYATGTFSITIQKLASYPKDVPTPPGPFRLLDEAEYNAARRSADITNNASRDQYDLRGSGLEIHEIQPIKFGGSPTDLRNKTLLDQDYHRRTVTPWWNELQREVQRSR